MTKVPWRNSASEALFCRSSPLPTIPPTRIALRPVAAEPALGGFSAQLLTVSGVYVKLLLVCEKEYEYSQLRLGLCMQSRTYRTPMK